MRDNVLPLFSVFVLSAAAFIASAADAQPNRRGYPEGTAGETGVFELGRLPDYPLLGEPDRLGVEVLYRFAGAVDSGEQTTNIGDAATSVHCTNTSGSSAIVEVQIMDFDGTVYAGSTTIPPSNSLTFSTHGTAFYFDDVTIGGGAGTPAIDQGSGQVLSAGSGIICNANVVDPENPRPEYLTSLEMF